MASSAQYLDYVCEKLQPYGAIRTKKMFGEYLVYLNDKPVVMVCDDTVFIKKLPALAEQMASAPCDVPYPGAKEHFILDMDDRTLLDAVLPVLEATTPLPKPPTKQQKA